MKRYLYYLSSVMVFSFHLFIFGSFEEECDVESTWDVVTVK